nr:MAG TPA: hypothetical protein [Caudoviricetes sp.]
MATAWTLATLGLLFFQPLITPFPIPAFFSNAAILIPCSFANFLTFS